MSVIRLGGRTACGDIGSKMVGRETKRESFRTTTRNGWVVDDRDERTTVSQCEMRQGPYWYREFRRKHKAKKAQEYIPDIKMDTCGCGLDLFTRLSLSPFDG